jgi:hypothetical protein
MILYSVQCSRGHVFDEWFDNSAQFDTRAGAHDIACPDCGDRQVTKAIMAPAIGKAASEPQQCPVGGCQGGNCPFATGF